MPETIVLGLKWDSVIYFMWQSSGTGMGERKMIGDDEVSEVQDLYTLQYRLEQ